MDSYQKINSKIKRTFQIRGQDIPPFMGHYQTSRSDLAKLFNTFGYKIGVEVGVGSGKHAKRLCKTVEGLKLYLVDPWIGYGGLSVEKAEARFENCQSRLKGCNVEFMRMPSMEAVRNFVDGVFDFVYIDGLHTFDGVMSDLIFWSPKVRSGGIIAGHDYLEFPQSGIIPAVRAYVTEHAIHEWYVTRDKDPSFFWVQK